MSYIAIKSADRQTSHPLFKQRGLFNLTAVQPSNIQIAGVAHVRELAYQGYMSNMDIFIASTLRGHKIKTNVQGARIEISKNIDTPHVNVPPVCIIPRHAFTPDMEVQFMARLAGQVPEKKKQGATTVYLLHRPDPESAFKYLQASQDRVSPSPNHVTPQGYLAICIARTFIAGFLRTQTYPAWRTPAQAFTEGEVVDKYELQVEIAELKRKVVGSEVKTKKKQKRVEYEDGTSDMEDVDEDEMIEYVEETFETEVVWQSMRDSVMVAKPSPLPLSYNLGGPADVPFESGICFPYFDRMMISDNTTMRGIVLNRGLRCLGDSRDEQRKVFKQVKLGLEQVGRLSCGQVLMHLLLGVNLAIETQSRMFVVYVSSEYAGFCLLGSQFSVLIDNEWHEVKTPEELAADVSKLSSHQFAVTHLSQRLSLCPVIERFRVEKGKPKEVVTEKDIATGQDLWKQLEKRAPSEDDQELITEYLGMVAYTRSYKPISLENILWALDMIVLTPDAPLPDNLPLYVPAAYGDYEDRVLKILCTFGPDAFSLVNGTGTKYQMTSLGNQNDPNNALSESGRGKSLPFIPVSIKSVQTCKTDMYRFLKGKEIFVDLKERAIPNRCMLMRGDARDKLYEKMKQVCHHKDPNAPAPIAGKKRKAEGQPEDAGDILNLF